MDTDLVEQLVTLRWVQGLLVKRDERRALGRVLRQLRRRLGSTVPKHQAAASLGVSPQALERWVRAAQIPVTRRSGSSRELIDSEALLLVAEEVARLHRAGRRRALAKALRTLHAEGRMPRKLQPNQSTAELRYEFLHTTPEQRLRAGIELSQTAALLARRGRERTAR